MNDSRATTLVIGVGNPMRTDDGIGPAAVARLGRDERLDGLDIELASLDGEPARLLDAWESRSTVVVVDAARAGSAPGAIVRVEVGADPLPGWTVLQSSHGAGLAEAVALATVLDRLPERLVIIAVEPDDLSFGEGLSNVVATSLEPLVDLIIAEVTS